MCSPRPSQCRMQSAFAPARRVRSPIWIARSILSSICCARDRRQPSPSFRFDMYVPSHFAEDRLPVLQDFMRQHPFATLVTLNAGGLVASHLPLLVEEEPAPNGRLIGHLARANSHWRDVDPKAEALAIFGGPHAYVSPSWYATKAEHGKVVPTWNYAAVHAYGALRIIEA